MAERPTRLLLIDDDEDAFLIVRHLLRQADEARFELGWADDYEAGLERFCRQRHDLCLLDYKLDGRDGLELLQEARARGVRMPVIMLTGLGSRAVDLEAMKAGVADYLVKDSLDAATLERAVRYVLERQRLLDALEAQSGRLRRLATEAGAAEQRERRRLAQILHDHHQQLLVAAKMQAGQLQGLADETAGRIGTQVTELLEEAIESSRNLSQELYPAVLYDRGLEAAIQWLGRRFGEQHTLEVEVEAEPGGEPEDQDLQAFLFQSVRELLLNAVKHGRADRVRVEMGRHDNVLTIGVEDNGAGCAPDQLFREPETGGFGLFSIRERLNVLGGSMSARSTPGKGCRIILQLPVEEPGADEEPGELEPERDQRPIRVMLADDHQIVREGLAGILRGEQDLDLVAEVSDGREAVERIEDARPDVVVMDVSMPRMDGKEATRVILRNHPEIRVIALSMHKEEGLARAMEKAGASAYLTKGGPASELLNAIREQGGRQPTV